jgi:hypothetical protein
MLATITATSATANPFFWYVTRAAAISSYMVLTIVVLLGIARTLTREAGSRASWVLDETHQFLALLTAALGAERAAKKAAGSRCGRRRVAALVPHETQSTPPLILTTYLNGAPT